MKYQLSSEHLIFSRNLIGGVSRVFDFIHLNKNFLQNFCEDWWTLLEYDGFWEVLVY